MTPFEGTTTLTCLERRSIPETRKLTFTNPWINVANGAPPKFFMDEHGLFSPRFTMTLSTRKRSVNTMGDQSMPQTPTSPCQPKKQVKIDTSFTEKMSFNHEVKKDNATYQSPSTRFLEVDSPLKICTTFQFPSQMIQKQMQQTPTPIQHTPLPRTPLSACYTQMCSPWQMKFTERPRMNSIVQT